jgi:hypothetical protein
MASHGRPPSFLDGDKAEVVEHDPASREPVEGGRVIPVTVVDLSKGEFTWLFVRVRMPDGGHAVFWRESRWLRWPHIETRWRLEATGNG